MKFFSTRGLALPCHLSEAIRQGLAPDGGLFVPSQWPSPQTFSQILHDSKWKELSFSQFAAKFLEPFFSAPFIFFITKVAIRLPTSNHRWQWPIYFIRAQPNI